MPVRIGLGVSPGAMRRIRLSVAVVTYTYASWSSANVADSASPVSPPSVEVSASICAIRTGSTSLVTLTSRPPRSVA
jgi:hypothetical protein